ncbi:MAG: hypothetical protein M3R32_06120 [Chloroflexota bacterium]|nr:hypothetical protein [Chloroflexota bacterium]
MGSQQGRPEIPAGMKDSLREVRFTSAEGERSIRSKLAQGTPIMVRLRIPPDSDVEGHSLGDSVVLAVAKFDDSDVEGHALSIHFPDAGQARRFRNEMIAAGALTATLALGVGLSQLAPNAELGQSQAGTQSNAVWIDTSAGMREGSLSSLSVGAQGGTAAQVREGGAAGPVFRGIPHQVAPDEGQGAAAPAVKVPHQVPPDDL